ncbi:MAG: hypothetical protein ACK47B_10200 [Armatimonadota bacterium]
MGASRYILFHRTEGHCVTWLVQATDLREALVRFLLDAWGDAGELLPDGSLVDDDGLGWRVVYTHPLQAIEANYKICEDWEIRSLDEPSLQAEVAEVFCSADPSDLDKHISAARRALREAHPRSRARAFVWYLRSGPLVTFYRRPRRGAVLEIVARYLLPWKDWPNARPWTGSYDDLLGELFLGPGERHGAAGARHSAEPHP